MTTRIVASSRLFNSSLLHRASPPARVAIASAFTPPPTTANSTRHLLRRYYASTTVSHKKADAASTGSTAPADESNTSDPSYFERKQARKQERTERYQAQFQRKLALKDRRSQAPKDVLKQDFHDWWDFKLAREQKWDRQARQQGKDWKLQVAVVLERLTQVLPDRQDFEKEFDELEAYLAQFGKEYPKEFASSSLKGNGAAPVSDEELIALLPEGFKPAPRETKADELGKTDTLDRRLKDSVYLVIDGSLPTTPVKDGDSESLLEAARRAVEENGGKNLELYCPSGAPVAVHMVKADDGDSKYFGTKTFFLRLQYDDGTIEQKDLKSKRFEWLDRNEIVESLEGADEHQAKFYRYLL